MPDPLFRDYLRDIGKFILYANIPYLYSLHQPSPNKLGGP